MYDDIPSVTLPSGKEVPALGLGTWNMGETRSSAPQEVESIRKAIDLGMTLIDTAEMYADGRSEEVVGAAIAGRLRAFFNTPRPAAATELFPELTAREREVLDLIAAGHNNEAIAVRLVVSRKTVRNHVSNIFNKLQVAGRAEAIIRARDAGMG